ncbi:hypothetical protein GCM10028832_04270 [Streptomyces sparsus]
MRVAGLCRRWVNSGRTAVVSAPCGLPWRALRHLGGGPAFRREHGNTPGATADGDDATARWVTGSARDPRGPLLRGRPAVAHDGTPPLFGH